jgi:hypothetical protein
MIRNAKKIIQNKQIEGRAGGFANESVFGGWERELRAYKVLTLASKNGDSRIEIIQGWNKTAAGLDVLKLIVIDENDNETELIVDREELEQALAYMAQGDELIKYAPSKIKK